MFSLSWPLCSLQLLLTLLHSEGLIVQLLIVLELEWEQIIAELRSKSLAEQLLLVRVICHLASGIASKTVELTSIGVDVHASLGQIHELLPLLVHNSLRYEGRTKSSAELRPGEDTACRG